MIQAYLRNKLNKLSEQKTIAEIAEETGIGRTSLERLRLKGGASIKSCEILMKYFDKQTTNALSGLSVMRVVNSQIENDVNLSDTQKKLLKRLFASNYRIVTGAIK